jgi:catechol 2,3-dioxygenase-like lactoylglutathione lyase family enzyme
MDSVWNLGVKVRDLDAELAFLKACGATGIEKGVNQTPDGELGFGMAFLGSQRLLLFPKVIYEGVLTAPLKHGIAHAVYQVENLASVLAKLRSNGVMPLWGPEEVATPFGRRRIVFFRSPSGFIFETFEHLG